MVGRNCESNPRNTTLQMPQIKFQPRISAAPISPLRSPLLPAFLPLGFCNEHQKRFVPRLPSGPRFAFPFYRFEPSGIEWKNSFLQHIVDSFCFGNVFIWLILFRLFIHLFIYVYLDTSGFKKGTICKIFFGRVIFFSSLIYFLC